MTRAIGHRIGGGRPPQPGGDFGRRLYAARRRAGLRQADVAALIGVQTNTVARWERGEFEPLAIVQRATLHAIQQVRRHPSSR